LLASVVVLRSEGTETNEKSFFIWLLMILFIE
jgi:hypothetical protein